MELQIHWIPLPKAPIYSKQLQADPKTSTVRAIFPIRVYDMNMSALCRQVVQARSQSHKSHHHSESFLTKKRTQSVDMAMVSRVSVGLPLLLAILMVSQASTKKHSLHPARGWEKAEHADSMDSWSSPHFARKGPPQRLNVKKHYNITHHSLKSINIIHRQTAPGHPATNVERVAGCQWWNLEEMKCSHFTHPCFWFPHRQIFSSHIMAWYLPSRRVFSLPCVTICRSGALHKKSRQLPHPMIRLSASAVLSRAIYDCFTFA